MILRKNPYKKLEAALGYRFRKRNLLEQAITHASFAHEQAAPTDHNQRLEFLGDAALGLVAAAALYRTNPDATEGELTHIRSLISSTKALAELAQRADLGSYLRLGRGEELGGGRIRPSILADALEAVIGAAYLDGGVKAVEKIFNALFSPLLNETASARWLTNPKGALQEWTQREGVPSPRYRVLRMEGPPHAPVFTVEVAVDGKPLAEGSGPSKRSAEAEAALNALRKLHYPGSTPPHDGHRTSR